MRNSENVFIGLITKRIFNTTVKGWETEHSSWRRKSDSRIVTLYKFIGYHIGPPIMQWGLMSHPSESTKCVFMKIHFIGLVRKFSDPNILERQLPWTYENGEILILPPWHCTNSLIITLGHRSCRGVRCRIPQNLQNVFSWKFTSMVGLGSFLTLTLGWSMI